MSSQSKTALLCVCVCAHIDMSRPQGQGVQGGASFSYKIILSSEVCDLAVPTTDNNYGES